MSRESPAATIERLRLENEQLLEERRIADEMRDRYMELYDCAPLAYLTLDGAGAIRQANQAAAALLHGRSDFRHLVGRRFKDLTAATDHETLAQHLRRCAATSHALSCDLRLRDASPVQLWSRRIRPGARLYPTVIVDLRELHRAAHENRRLLEAQKEARAASEAKDHFIATLSHELRAPLTPVLAAVSALRVRAGIPENLRGLSEMIHRNILTEARLIDDLLDVTRIVQRKMHLERSPVDVHQAAREALEVLETEIAAKQLPVGVFLEADHHFAAGDLIRLKQVFWNLLRNAAKFTPAGGRIEVRSWNSAAGGRQRLHVEVSDTGAGFDPDEALRLFEPFEQGPQAPERSGGLGLGLAICRGVMELHGGHIVATSRGRGLGARFVIEIDTVEGAPAPPRPEAAPMLGPAPPESRLRLLLVDDHEDTADLLGELLDDAGYKVSIAHSAQAALAENLDEFDLVISDIGLPGTSGLDLMRTIRAAHPLKGVALSGYGTEADIRASKEAGFSAHLTKPVDFQHLLATIRQVGGTYSLH